MAPPEFDGAGAQAGGVGGKVPERRSDRIGGGGEPGAVRGAEAAGVGEIDETNGAPAKGGEVDEQPRGGHEAGGRCVGRGDDAGLVEIGEIDRRQVLRIEGVPTLVVREEDGAAVDGNSAGGFLGAGHDARSGRGSWRRGDRRRTNVGGRRRKCPGGVHRWWWGPRR